MKINFFRVIVLSIFFLTISACSINSYRSYSEIPTQNKIYISESFLSLKQGMTVEEVRAIMGKPDDTNLVADMWFPESGNRYNQLKVLYVGGVAARAIWISLTHDGHFVLFG